MLYMVTFTNVTIYAIHGDPMGIGSKIKTNKIKRGGTWQIWQDGLDIERCQEDHRELRSLVIVSP